MANVKISALNDEATPANTDVAPITKADNSETKKCNLQLIAQLFSDNTVAGHSATARVTNVVSCTTAQYNAISVKSSTTLYMLTD
jgi:hypothetical protein|tara:strand:+ start:207 stop:461 length:255 start_codon:yes stop_codon:yes gene_type:complete